MSFGFYPRKTADQAVAFYKKGYSFRRVGVRLGVSSQTVARWVHATGLLDSRLISTRRQSGVKGVENGKDLKINKATGKILASLLYWCEGAKFPSTNYVSFSNSDITLVLTFLKLFRYSFKLSDSKFRAHLQLHNSHDEDAVIRHWSELLSIPRRQFLKSTITKAGDKRKRQKYMGTCTVRYYDVYCLRELMSIYDKFSQRILRMKL